MGPSRFTFMSGSSRIQRDTVPGSTWTAAANCARVSHSGPRRARSWRSPSVGGNGPEQRGSVPYRLRTPGNAERPPTAPLVGGGGGGPVCVGMSALDQGGGDEAVRLVLGSLAEGARLLGEGEAEAAGSGLGGRAALGLGVAGDFLQSVPREPDGHVGVLRVRPQASGSQVTRMARTDRRIGAPSLQSRRTGLALKVPPASGPNRPSTTSTSSLGRSRAVVRRSLGWHRSLLERRRPAGPEGFTNRLVILKQ